jgi:hypothetical protein
MDPRIIGDKYYLSDEAVSNMIRYARLPVIIQDPSGENVTMAQTEY